MVSLTTLGIHTALLYFIGFTLTAAYFTFKCLSVVDKTTLGVIGALAASNIFAGSYLLGIIFSCSL